MEPKDLGTTTVYTFNNLSGFENLLHFVSTRAGGTSDRNFSSLNTGFHVGDNNFRVLQNRRILMDALGVDLAACTFANQCHSANVAIVNETGKGKGAMERDTAIPNTDGMVTNVPGICLAVQVADCVPVLLYDPVHRVVASLHAGWKGTLRKIVQETIAKMVRHYDTRAENIYAGLGPSNGPCCYEVGEDVYREARGSLGTLKGIVTESKKPGKYIFDQWEANVRQLKEKGVPADHIELAEICSECRHEEFFSSRKHQGVTGRFMAGIMQKKIR